MTPRDGRPTIEGFAGQTHVTDLDSRFRQARQKAGPFPLAAYEFVREGLAYTARGVHGEEPAKMRATDEASSQRVDESRHVSGRQLCLGLREYAQRQYGRLAKTVLAKWHIRGTEDFGKIVFAMIDAGMMRKTDEDSAEDFRDVFSFDDAFVDLPSKPNRQTAN
jgi:uncharacterized repeat protein (TIGR04138 family)